MKRIIFTLLLISALALPLFGQGATSVNIYARPDADWLSGARGGQDPAWEWMKQMDDLMAGLGAQGTGNNYYVDSGLTTAGDGSNWANALATVDEAVALCDDDNGDVIHVAAGHTEDWASTTGDDIDLDVPGIAVIGYGRGEARPLFTADDADGELVIGDASIMIANLRFMSSIDSTIHLIEVEADADGFVIYNCEFMEPESASTVDEAVDIIQVAAGANKGFIVGCTFYSLSAGANTAIDLTAGVIEDITIAYNYMNGAWAEGAIFSDDIDLRARIIGNTVVQLDTAMTPITFDAAATGWMVDNLCQSKSTTYVIDAGSMQCSGNLWSDTDTADVAAVPMFTSETGVDIWAASQTTQISTAVTTSIDADELDTMLTTSAGTGQYPSNAIQDSVISHMLSSSANPVATSYDNRTDSLQAIADHVQTLITTAAGTGVYPTGITNESIIAFMLAEGATATASTFNNTTDSLEAIRNRVDTINTADQVDLDAILLDTGTTIPAAIAAITTEGFRASCEVNAGGTAHVIAAGLSGFGTDYFNTGWYILVLKDADGLGAAPEGEIRDIVDYDNVSDFTVGPAFSAAVTTDDEVMIVRAEAMNFNDIAILGGSGRILYVDSGVAGTADVGDLGDTWDLAYPTLTAALDATTASNGDVIYVAAGHTETITAGYAFDDAGVTIIGLGDSDLRPTIVFNDTAAQIDVSAADITIENFIMETSETDVVAGIDIATGGDGFTIRNCSFVDVAATTDEFLIAINLQAGADDITIEGCEFLTTGSAATEGIYIAGAVDNFQFLNNYMNGTWTVAPVWCNSTTTNALIKGNTIFQDKTNQFAIEFTTASVAEGLIADNLLYTDAYATMLDPGSMICLGNKGTIALDESPIDIPESVNSASTAEEDDGSNLERLEYLQNKVEDILAGIRMAGGSVGDVYYCDDGGAGGTGTTWATAETTLDVAWNNASANVGDIIFVAPAHSENIGAAQITCDTAGVTIWGLGEGAEMAELVFNDATSSIDVTGAGVTIKGLRLYSTTIDTTIGIDVDADSVTLEDLEFADTGGFEFNVAIDLGATAENAEIRRCQGLSSSGTDGDAFISNTGGVIDKLVIEDCRIWGDYDLGGIYSTQINTNALIKNNSVTNNNSGIYAIQLTAAMTGELIGNMLAGDTYGSILDPGSMRCFGNMQSVGTDAAAEDIPLIAGKSYARAKLAGDLNANDDLFDVVGSPIIVTDFVGYCVVDVEGNPISSIICDSDDTFDYDLTTAVDVTSCDPGGLIAYTAAIAESVTTPVAKGNSGSMGASVRWFVQEGMLISNVAAGAAGEIEWYMVFTPVESGGEVIPQ